MHYTLEFKADEQDGQCRQLGEEQCEVNIHFFNKRQVLDLESDNIGQEKDAEDVDLEGIDVSTSEKKIGL